MRINWSKLTIGAKRVGYLQLSADGKVQVREEL